MSPDQRQRWLRDGVLVVGVLMAFALGWMAYTLNTHINRASELVERGRAEVFLDLFQNGFDPWNEDATQAAMEQLLEEQRNSGLRHLAILAPANAVEVGNSTVGMTPLRYGQRPPTDVLERSTSGIVRFIHAPDKLPLPPHATHPQSRHRPQPWQGPAGAFGGAQPPQPPDRGTAPLGGPPRPPEFGGPGQPGGVPDPEASSPEPPIFVLEFQPIVADELRRKGTWAIVMGIFGALICLVGAVVVWLLLRQREVVMAQLAHKQQLAALGEMSAVMAHELRNPLASAKGHAQLLAEYLDSGSRASAKSHQVISELVRLEGLTNDLLAFVRSGRVSQTPIDPADMVQMVVEQIDDDRIDLVACDDPGLWHLDPVAMERVVSNLIQNALQASPEASPVIVTVDVQSEQLRILVRDHGKGIPKGKEKSIFEPFVTTRMRGTGLGLAVSRQIIEAHGGEISATNAPDGGALFSCTIPRRRP
ncbi:MAG: HAMP domain-containing sensor histidine kinase [Myxococcota bacterium]